MTALDTARLFVGYLEHARPEQLELPTANVGKGGCTIFAEMVRRREGIDLQGLPWCCTFIHAIVGRPEILGRAHPGVRVLERRMILRGYWRPARGYVPDPGDLIFLTERPDHRISHVGIVETAEAGSVTSIDGNTVDPSGHFAPKEGGAVARRKRDSHDARIAGYAAIGRLLKSQ